MSIQSNNTKPTAPDNHNNSKTPKLEYYDLWKKIPTKSKPTKASIVDKQTSKKQVLAQTKEPLAVEKADAMDWKLLQEQLYKAMDHNKSIEQKHAFKCWTIRLVAQIANKDSKLARELLAYLLNPHLDPSELSYAEPFAAMKWQKQLTRMLLELFANESTVYFATIILPNAQPAGELTSDCFDSQRKLIARACKAAGLTYAAGGFDISLNAYDGYDGNYVYAPHLSLFFTTNDIKHVKRVFAEYFVATTNVPRPALTKRTDKNRRVYEYALKPNFYRRITVPATANKRQDSSKQEFIAKHLVELLGILRGMRFKDRLFLHNLTIRHDYGTGKSSLTKDKPRGTTK